MKEDAFADLIARVKAITQKHKGLKAWEDAGRSNGLQVWTGFVLRSAIRWPNYLHAIVLLAIQRQGRRRSANPPMLCRERTY